MAYPGGTEITQGIFNHVFAKKIAARPKTATGKQSKRFRGVFRWPVYHHHKHRNEAVQNTEQKLI
jgi:hypothetical protein